MDKNSSIGFLLLFVLFFLFLKKNNTLNEINRNKNEIKIEEKIVDKNEDDKSIQKDNGILNFEKEYILENDEIKVTFSNIGANIKNVELKKYKNSKKENVVLMNDESGIINYKINDKNNEYPEINTLNLIFKNKYYDDERIEFEYVDEIGNEILATYNLKNNKDGFIIEHSLKIGKNKCVEYFFENKLIQQESNINDCRNKSTIFFYDNKNNIDRINEFSEKKESKKNLEDIKWLAYKQKFFSTGIFFYETINCDISTDLSNGCVKKCRTKGLVKSENNEIKIKYFFGPNKYDELKNFDNTFCKIIYLGMPGVRLFNRYICMPFIDFLSNYVGNILLVMVLAILINILLLPINFKQFVVMQKIQSLKNLLNIIRSKYKDNQQQLAIEQIGLYKYLGVNPLMPILYSFIQFPFFVAIYNYLPLNFSLRGNKFLWCKDISTYDSVYDFGFNVPFYGDHVSLMAILMPMTMLLFMCYNNFNNGFKNISPFYVFFIIFMICISNKFCCALNLYYMIFNSLNIILQKVYKKIINIESFLNKVNKKMEEFGEENQSNV